MGPSMKPSLFSLRSVLLANPLPSGEGIGRITDDGQTVQLRTGVHTYGLALESSASVCGTTTLLLLASYYYVAHFDHNDNLVRAG